jgi:Fe2+ or Zn2+ uptake regulation protein
MTSKADFEPGMRVVINHLAGREIGLIESINLKNGKVTIFIEDPNCPHFYTANLNQIETIDEKSKI